MSKYADIIARLEKSDGADYELDAEIAICTGEIPYPPEGGSVLYVGRARYDLIDKYGDFVSRVDLDDYTFYVEPALALVERLLPGWYYVLKNVNIVANEPETSCDIFSPAWVRGENDSEEATAKAATLPIAILLALFRALEAKTTP